MNKFCKSMFLLLSCIIAAHCSSISESSQLAPPILLSPIDGEIHASIPVIFIWEPLSGVDTYFLQLLNENGEEILEKQINASEELSLDEQSVNYGEVYYWQVQAINTDHESEWSEQWSFVIQDNPVADNEINDGNRDYDSDNDGIPDSIESNIFHTDPDMKTLFIRPKKRINIAPPKYEYWERFITLFSDTDTRPGFADIPALTKAGIEVVVIGCPASSQCSGNNCRYPEFDNFDYPCSDIDKNLPCDILEIIYEKETNKYNQGIHCAASSVEIPPRPEQENGQPETPESVNGHIYFNSGYRTLQNGNPQVVSTWSWDIMGYTKWFLTDYDYYTPRIFPFPLKNYFKEGSYRQIEQNETPIWTNCSAADEPGSECQECEECTSTMNFNDDDSGPPFSNKPDQTVEFNKIFYETNGKINSIESIGKKYSEDEVLQRIITHEIGHALLGSGLDNGHCSNPKCIMYKYTLDWEMREFGKPDSSSSQGTGLTVECEHSKGNSFDIRLLGIVHNSVHNNVSTN